MITFATLAADTVPAAALNANAAGAVSADGAGEFGNVLQQWMGAPPNAGVDLPLDDQDDEAGDEDDLDELVTANGIDPAAQPIMRLMPAAMWMAGETAAAATPRAASDTPMAERSMSAAAILGAPLAGVDTPAPVAVNAAPAFAALMAKAASAPADESPIADLPMATAPSVETPAAVPAASPQPTPIANALFQAMEDPAVPAATTESHGATVVPTPESAPRDAAPASAAPRRSAEKDDPARQVSRITVEAGQRAYAAASEGSKKDTQTGCGEGRHDSRANIEASPATPSTPTATPFQVVVDRPVPPVAVTVGGAVVVAPEAVEAAVATELPAQVVQSIRIKAIDGGGEAIVRLRPDYLGELVVAVKVENGAVIAALQSEVPAVRKWVENNEATLRQALAEHGLQLARLTVSDEAPTAEGGERGHRDQKEHQDESQPQPRRQRKAAPDATFEVIV